MAGKEEETKNKTSAADDQAASSSTEATAEKTSAGASKKDEGAEDAVEKKGEEAVDPEEAKKAEETKKLAEEARKAAEDAKAKAEEEERKKAEMMRRAEDAKRAEEAKKAAAEAQKKAAEERKKAEAEAKKKAEEEAAKKAAEAKAAEDAARKAAEEAAAAEAAALDPAEKKRREREAADRKRKNDKKIKLKEKKKVAKAEEVKASGGKPAKGVAKTAVKPGKVSAIANVAAKTRKDDDEDEIEVDYVVPEVLAGNDDPEDETFVAIMERFKYVEPEKLEELDPEEEEAKPKKRTKPKASLLEEGEDSDDDEQKPSGDMSKKKRRLNSRMSVAELKTLVKRPDVVELWDTTSTDPRLLVYLKAYRNTCLVPKHWSSKRKYMAGKRGVEKPPFKLPEYIEATGIAKIRQAIMEKQADMSMKQRSRERAHPKMGKLDIDYQVLHDAFFKYANKPKMTRHNDMYYEGKEYETKMLTKRPGQLSAALKEALGMEEEGHPPPWLINMQRYGPPPAYPNLKIPGLNAPIPQGAEYGYHPGGWGKPPVDELGNPLYGDWKQNEAPTPSAPEDTTLWGEVEDYEDEEDDEEDERVDGAATPMLGTATPLVGTGSATPVVSAGGMHSISGVSSLTSGMDTPGTGGSRSKKGGIASVSGISSASLTPTPQLFQVLEEQKGRATKKGVYPSSHTYKMGSKSGGGSSTPIGGVGSSGTGTPIGGIGTPIGGIGTPIGGIGTPHGISTPHGIGTPGLGTGTRTPHGISTPLGVGSAGGFGTGTGTPLGHGTPGIGTPMGGIGTPIMGGISTPVGGIATPVGGIATPVGGIATPIGGIATPIGGIATPMGGMGTPLGIATPTGGIATPTGIPGGAPTPLGGADTPGPVTMSLNPGQVETEGILTADIIRQQLKQHEEAAAKAKLAAGQKEVAQKNPVKAAKKKKDKTKFKF